MLFNVSAETDMLNRPGGYMLRYWALPVVMLIAFMTTACQTSMLKQFSSLKPGMEKDDVLGIMGSPRQTWRAQGKDRWLYTFYDDRIRFEKEVQFFEGNAVYIGDVRQPEESRSAVAVDTANELKNREIDEQIVKEVAKHRQEYENYEKEVRGQGKEVRYVPTFTPIK